MKKLAWALVALLTVGCGPKEEYSRGDVEREEFDGLRLKAEDGTTVFAQLVQTERVEKGVVLMFHQAGSNMHEYDPIAKEVASLGWDCLKVDQRSGGEMWGEINLTMSQFPEDQSFLSAYSDLEAALDWAESESYDRIIAWGSSYTASLVLKLASENESIDAVFSFSPGEYERLYPEGEYSEDAGLVGEWNSEVNVPVFFAGTGKERDVVNRIKDTAPDTPERHRDFVQTSGNGVHGSSVLHKDKNPEGYKWHWDFIERFLSDVESDGRAFGG